MGHLAQRLITYCKQNGITLFFAESVTCGLIASRLGNAIGTSDVLMGSIVCYTEEAKYSLTGLNKAFIKKYTAESQEITNALVKKLRSLCNADLYAAITGLAAPGGSETKTKPVGTAFFSVMYHGKLYSARKVFRGTPSEIKLKCCRYMYSFIFKTLNQ